MADDYTCAAVQQALASDPSIAEIGIAVTCEGDVLDPARRGRERRPPAARSSAGRATWSPTTQVRNEITVDRGRAAGHRRGSPVIRVAAVGDVHVDADVVGRFRPALSDIAEHADVLLIAGDLTRHGTLEEAKCVLQEFGGLPVPVVVVLGNHDYQSDLQMEMADLLTEGGLTVLEGTGVVLPIRRPVPGHRRGQGIRRWVPGPDGGRVRRAGDEGVRAARRGQRAGARGGAAGPRL